MLVNRCFLSSFNTTCVSLEEERKQEKRVQSISQNFLFWKKSSRKEATKKKKERKNAKKVTKSDQMHSFPFRASLALSLPPLVCNNSNNKERALVSSHQTLNSQTLSFIQQGLEFLGFKKPWLSSNKGAREIYILKKEANMRVSSNMGIKKRGFQIL